ncbi:SLC13 family permease [Actinopolymorpha pittospori]
MVLEPAAGSTVMMSASAHDLGGDGLIALAVFAVATAAWMFTRIDDTFIALGASLLLVLTGVLDPAVLFGSLGSSTIWLLIAAFVVAAGVTHSGLATRVAAFLVSGARTVRQLFHLLTGALIVTAVAVPATSGRAALALPVFVALAGVLRERKRVVVALALLFPTVILLSAVATLIGAGAHLITVQLLADTTGQHIGFGQWLLLGLPLALVSSHLAAELILVSTTRPEDRRQGVLVNAEEIGRVSGTAVTGPLSGTEWRAAALVAMLVVAWCTEPLHGLSPAVVTLVGAVLTTAPRIGTIKLKQGIASIPWSLLVFMAATMAMGTALSVSGGASWLTEHLLGWATPGATPVWAFLAVVVAISTAAHLLLQSRSARSSVLVPLVITAAQGFGVSPGAAAFASTAAAGFCQTLPSSAKPVALFADVDGLPTYTPKDLLRLAVLLAPLTALLVLAFAVTLWPALGLPLR